MGATEIHECQFSSNWIKSGLYSLLDFSKVDLNHCRQYVYFAEFFYHIFLKAS